MQKWMWGLIIGAIITYCAYKWNKTAAIVAGLATVGATYYFYAKG
jgi:hypothetical protein